MALTITKVGRSTVFGDRRVRFFDITFDTSYPTGGEALTPANLELTRIDFLQAHSKGDDPAYVVNYDYTNEKILVFGVEQDADAAVTEPFDQENDTADLSGLIVRVMVIGA